MKPSSLVGHILELLDLIDRLKQPADHIVKQFFRNRHYLGSSDRRFLSDTLFDILRHYYKVRFFADAARQHLNLASLSPSAIYIAYAIKIRHAADGEVLASVEPHWRFSFPHVECRQFIEAVNAAEMPADLLENPSRFLSLEHSVPEFIVAEWISRFGAEETGRLCSALNQQAPIVVRVNTVKATRDECQARLINEGVDCVPTRFSPVGLLLQKRINAQALQSFKEGWFEMQDEGSQLLSMLMEARPGQILVDACAGGGGKTLHLAALMKNEGIIHAIDVDGKRLQNIRPRLLRSGVAIAHLYHAEKDRERIELLHGTADAVLVDAPCSGVGTFRRNPGAKLTVSQQFVERMVKTQRSVLEKYAPLVRKGGRLVYSTCTLLEAENEGVFREFLQSHPEFELLPVKGILQNDIPNVSSGYLLLLPHNTGTDGFFAAVMRRRS